MKPLTLLVLVLVLSAHGPCAADSAALLRCRSVADPGSRLACYDAISLPAANASATASSAPATAAPVMPGMAAAIPSAGAPQAAAAPDPMATFGLEQRVVQSPGSAALTSSIPGRFEGWRANGRVRLANGQIWQVSDGSEAAYDLRDPQVRITRGVAGTFFMEIAGVSQTPRVRRIQ